MNKLLERFKISLQYQFIIFTSVTFTIVFALLSFFIYQQQRNSIFEANETRMYAHVNELVNTLDIYYKEKLSVMKNAGNGISKILTYNQHGLVETDSSIIISAKSFNKEDPLNFNNVVDVKVNQWLYQGKSLHNGDHFLVDTQGETLGGLVSIFQKTDKGYLVVQSNLRFDGKNRSENVLVNEEILNEAMEGEEIIRRIDILSIKSLALYKPLVFNGTTKGVIFIGIHENVIERTRDIFNSVSYFNTGYPYTFNKKGKYLIHPYLEGDSIAHLKDVSVLNKKTHGKQRYLHNVEGKKFWKWMYYQYYEPYDMFVAASVDENEFLDKPLAKIRNIIFIGLILALTIGITGIYFLVKTITTPINHLSAKLELLAKGHGVELKIRSRKDEIGDITKSVEKVIEGVNTASTFAQEIGNENYDAHFQPLSDKDILGNALLDMKNKLEEGKNERQKREWINKGINHFSKLLRRQFNNLEELTDSILKEIIEYLDANQGALYIVDKENGKEKLFLQSFFAWNRKKHLKKEILPGEGQVGQIWLEKEAVYLENVPEHYVNISSALGEASPRMVLILPLKVNEEVFGVLEIASFKKLLNHQLKFVHQVAADIGSTISKTKNNERTKNLLAKTQKMTQVLRNQEEEMLQNVEELQSTQEEMARKERNLKKELLSLRKENEELKSKKEA